MKNFEKYLDRIAGNMGALENCWYKKLFPIMIAINIGPACIDEETCAECFKRLAMEDEPSGDSPR